MQYSLLPGESFLRMQTTGTAPSGYSVMARFPFTDAVASLTYGTAYHWDTRAPRNYFDWTPTRATELMTFEPTHEFVIPTDDGGNYLGAVYHASTPGWAIDSEGRLLGCILRNTPGDVNPAATGTDWGSHTSVYALRVPGKAGVNQLQNPTAGCQPGGPLGEALQFNNPLAGVAVPGGSTAELPASLSLLSTGDTPAVIMVAKAGTMNETDLIVRVYQPTNQSLPG